MSLDINMTDNMSIMTVLETLKVFMRGQIISFVVHKRRKSVAAQVKSEDQIKQIESRNAEAPAPDLHKERLQLRTEYDLLTSHNIENQ